MRSDPVDPCDEPLDHPADPFALVLFGATGDLTRRKLLPAFYSLAVQGLIREPFAVVAFARREGNDDTFREAARSAIKEFAPHLPTSGETWDRFASSLYYHRSPINDPAGYRALGQRLEKLDRELGLGGRRLFYLAIPPEHFVEVVDQLGKANLVAPYEPAGDRRWTRVIVEKPFGHDLDSALALNTCLRSVFDEGQIFRIDHYLGKETVQNILVTRFANRLYELLWNQTVIDNVQITVAETLGMEGRGEYFDSAGITRDMIQNHALQILTLIAMEPPVDLRADSIRDEKVKVLQSIRPFNAEEMRAQIVRGQYTAGEIPGENGGDPVAAYGDEEGVAPGSKTETYAAMRFWIDNWRWAGVPFYVRAGKRLPTRVTEVTIELKAIPDVLFARMDCVEVEPNQLTIRIQPHEGIGLKMSAKVPGPRMKVEPVHMRFNYAEEFQEPIPEAYERLILDAILGEAALFARADEVEAAWRLITPILQAWAASQEGPFPYKAGDWGPAAGDQLIRSSGRKWHDPGEQA
jgi:glucose-6-phosphate 1-dehydrogenase